MPLTPRMRKCLRLKKTRMNPKRLRENMVMTIAIMEKTAADFVIEMCIDFYYT